MISDVLVIGSGISGAMAARALVDSGASGLLLPKQMVEFLGLTQFRIRSGRTISGTAEIPMYRAVRLTIQGRDCISDVGEIPDGNPVVIGQVPLEVMDWVIDMKGHKIIGNPDHNGEWMMDIFNENPI